MIFADAQPVLAAPPGIFLFRAKSRVTETAHSPNYKRYRGNSRHKPRKLGVWKRWRLRVKAKHKAKAHKMAPTRARRTTL
ncbi:hypothetical protein GCM10022406_23800 [Hymenobacter algoricola]|uniref:50S ribosomal protein L34 n=2 Tax=Hymenobacter algoricola TaxID=486267 RepID=A0ABP7N708_9BACT